MDEALQPGAQAPSDADLAKARAAETRRANFAKARAALAAKRAAKNPQATGAGPESPGAGSAEPTVSETTLAEGSRAFVKLAWLIARLCAAMAGGKLSPLEEAELHEGAKEAIALVRRVRWLVVLLSLVGFPLWLVSKAQERFIRKPKGEAEKAADNVHTLPARGVQ